MEDGNLHFQQLPSWYWCSWPGTTLRTTPVEARIVGQPEEIQVLVPLDLPTCEILNKCLKCPDPCLLMCKQGGGLDSLQVSLQLKFLPVHILSWSYHMVQDVLGTSHGLTSGSFPSLGQTVSCLSSPYLIHSTTGSICLPLVFIHFAHLPTSQPSENHQFVLCIYESVSACCLFCVLDSTCKWNYMVFIFLCLTYFTYIIPSRSIHVFENGKISFFFMAE